MKKGRNLSTLARHLEVVIPHSNLMPATELRNYIVAGISHVMGEKSKRAKKMMWRLNNLDDKYLVGYITELYLKGKGLRTTGNMLRRKVGGRRKYEQVRM